MPIEAVEWDSRLENNLQSIAIILQDVSRQVWRACMSQAG